MPKLIPCIGSALLLLAPSAPVTGQTAPRAEIGTQMGVSVLHAGGETLTTISSPGGGFAGRSSLYAVLFAGSRLAFEPRLGFSRSSSDGNSFSTVDAAARVRLFYDEPVSNSAYLYGEGGVLRAAGSRDSDSNFAAGGGFGFRYLATPHLAITTEAGYRRWFSEIEDFNEFTASIGFGAVIGREGKDG